MLRDNDNIDYGALFGVDVEGAEVTEPAEPSTDSDTGAQGEREQEIAEPAGVEDVDPEAGDDVPEEENGDDRETGAEDGTQTREERSKYAAARRKAEAQRDEAIEKAQREAQAEAQRIIDEAFKNSGLTNPYTKKPITTKAEYDEYRARYDEEQKKRVLKNSGMNDEEFNRFVENLPEVRAAREARKAAEQAQKETEARQAKLQMDAEIQEISRMDPAIKELKDLVNMDTYPEFYRLVKLGNSFVDAYRLANFDKLSQSTAAAARQAAVNSTRSKDHLGRTTSRGTGAVSVPKDVAAAYRAFNPKATDAEIQKHYANYIKK